MSKSKEGYTPKKDKRLPFKLDFSKTNRIPWTKKQEKLINILTRKQKFDLSDHIEAGEDVLNPVDTKCCFIKGMAGCAKTFTGVYSALQLLNERKIDTIIYLRTVVESSHNCLGFLTGDYDQKIGVYMQPLMNVLTEILPENQIKTLIDGGFIKSESTNFLRGQNLHNCVVIADESQNYTWGELVTITSRMAERSRLWFCYDPKQSDLANKYKNDMVNFSKVFDGDDLENRLNGIAHFEFNRDDIVRSGFCRYVLEKLEDYEEKKKILEYEKSHNFDSTKNHEDLKLKTYQNEEWILGEKD